MNEQPVGIYAALFTLANAVLALAAWVWELKPEAVTLISAVIAAAIALGGAVVWKRVTPMVKLWKLDPDAARKVEAA